MISKRKVYNKNYRNLKLEKKKRNRRKEITFFHYSSGEGRVEVETI